MENTLPPFVTRTFPPSPDALLTAAIRLVTDDMLREISEADYGIGAAKYLAQLRRIRDEQSFTCPLYGPKEVLDLIRWSEPSDPTWKPGGVGERGHIMRAFACAALLSASAHPVNAAYFYGENQTLIQLIDSALYLRRGLPEAAASFLTWRTPMLREDEDRPFFAFGLLAIALFIRAGSFSRSEVDELAAFVEREESAERAALGAQLPEGGEEWLLGLTFYNLNHRGWRALARRLGAHASQFDSVTSLIRRIKLP